MAAKKYIHKVTGAAAVLRSPDGNERYFYRGAVVPEGIDTDSLKHAVTIGLVSRVEVVDPDAEAEAAAAAAKAKADAAAKAKADAAAKAKADAAAK